MAIESADRGDGYRSIVGSRRPSLGFLSVGFTGVFMALFFFSLSSFFPSFFLSFHKEEAVAFLERVSPEIPFLLLLLSRLGFGFWLLLAFGLFFFYGAVGCLLWQWPRVFLAAPYRFGRRRSAALPGFFFLYRVSNGWSSIGTAAYRVFTRRRSFLTALTWFLSLSLFLRILERVSFVFCFCFRFYGRPEQIREDYRALFRTDIHEAFYYHHYYYHYRYCFVSASATCRKNKQTNRD